MSSILWPSLAAVAALVLISCRSRDSSALRSATAEICPSVQVEPSADFRLVTITFPAECLAMQLDKTLSESFVELNTTAPRYFAGREFRAVDAHIAFISDGLSFDNGVSIQDKLLSFNTKNTVKYRIKVDSKEARHSEAWVGASHKVEVLVTDWVSTQSVKSSTINQHFGAANDADRKRINTYLDFVRACGAMSVDTTGILTVDQLALSPRASAKLQSSRAIAAALVEATKNDLAIKALLPPAYQAFKLDEHYIANGGIESNGLVLRLTPRPSAATLR